MVRSARCTTMCLVVTGVFGCVVPADQRTRASVSETTVGGWILVENDGRPTWSEPWIAEETLRLGSAQEGGPTQFGWISGFDVDDRGTAYVADGLEGQVRVFDSLGAHVRTFGQIGEGPGEFVALTGVKVFGTSLWTRDSRTARYSVFDTEGNLLRTQPMHAPSPLPDWQAQLDTEGGLIDWLVDLPYTWAGAESVWKPARMTEPRVWFWPVRHSSSGAVRDTLPGVTWRYEPVKGRIGPRPTSSVPSVHLDSSLQIWVTDPSEYRIDRRSLDGDTVVVFTLQADRRSLSQSERFEIAQAYPGGPIPLSEVPAEVPALKGIVSGPDVVLVFPDISGLVVGAGFDMFRRSGEYLGRVRLPRQIQLRPEPVFRGTELWAVALDELDVQYLVRFDLTPQASN